MEPPQSAVIVSRVARYFLTLPDYTFDHRRAVTPLAHLVADDRAGVTESDLTHLDEVVERHDLRRDVFKGDRAAFAQRCRDNSRHRGMHHHVFVTRSGVELVEHVGLRVEAVTARRPHHIIILARAPHASDAATRGAGDELQRALSASPFPSDVSAMRPRASAQAQPRALRA